MLYILLTCISNTGGAHFTKKLTLQIVMGFNFNTDLKSLNIQKYEYICKARMTTKLLYNSHLFYVAKIEIWQKTTSMWMFG